MTEEKKRTPRELTVSAARAKIRKLDSEYQADAEAVAKAAVDKLRERYAAKRAAILLRFEPGAVWLGEPGFDHTVRGEYGWYQLGHRRNTLESAGRAYPSGYGSNAWASEHAEYAGNLRDVFAALSHLHTPRHPAATEPAPPMSEAPEPIDDAESRKRRQWRRW